MKSVTKAFTYFNRVFIRRKNLLFKNIRQNIQDLTLYVVSKPDFCFTIEDNIFNCEVLSIRFGMYLGT